MKKYSCFCLFLATCFFCANSNLFAQSTTREINVSGLKVIFKKTTKKVITAALFIRGGVVNVSDDQQGLEPLTLNLVLNGGTTTMNKDAFAEESDRLGTNFVASSYKDYSSLSMTCLSDNWNESWKIFMDAILHPALDSNEFVQIKAKLISSAKQQDANPDAYLRKLANQQLFSGTPYARIPNGVPETLEKLQLSDAKNFYAGLLARKKTFLVIVGNVDEKDLVDKIAHSLASLPEGKLPSEPVVQGVTKASVNISDRNIATNYIIGTLNGPRYASADGPLFEFAMSVLYDRYFVELRTKRSLSYAPMALYNKSQVYNPLTQLYISTIDPKQSLEVMNEIINDIKKNGFTEKEVADKKKGYLTRYYMTNEGTNSQVNTLGLCEASGDWRLFDAINTQIDKVKTRDLNRVFNKYMNTVAWTYLGRKDKVSEADFKQPDPSREAALPASKIVRQRND